MGVIESYHAGSADTNETVKITAGETGWTGLVPAG